MSKALEGGGGASHADVRGNPVPSKGNSARKGPEGGSRTSEVSEAEPERAGGRAGRAVLSDGPGTQAVRRRWLYL